MTVHHGDEHPTRPADGAKAHQHRLSPNGVAHLVVVADELDRIRAGLAGNVDTDDEAVPLHAIALGGLHEQRCRREEHVVGGHRIVRRVGDEPRDHEGRRNPDLSPTGNAPGSRCAADEQRRADHSERPPPHVQEIRHVDAAYALTVGQRHDEIHIGDFEQHQQEDAEVEESLHGIHCSRRSPTRSVARQAQPLYGARP